MNALLNAHTKRGCDSPPHIGFASNVSPEAQSSQTGVSSEYVQQEGYNWFVLRATYNRVNAAVEKAKKNDIKTYVPMHYVLKVIAGKKKRIQQPLLPNFLFIYATREQSDSFVKYNPQIQISAESETKRSIFREKDKTKRSKKESAQHSKSRNKSFVMTSVSAL